MRKFRIVRICIAIFLFVLISIQFLDLYHTLPECYYKYGPLHLQFTPSLLNMIACSSLIAGAAFFVFSFIALLFGRVYCSYVCPFGILMDILRYISLVPCKFKFSKNTRLGKFCKNNFAILKFKKARNIARTSFLAIAVMLILLGFTSLLGFLDPYSLYGKIMGSIVHTAAAYFANTTSDILYSYDIYSISPVSGSPWVSLSAFSIALFILIAIWLASALRGRLFCNTMCPVGAFLGFLSKFSLLKVYIDNKKCVHCGLCEKNCKAQCIDSKNASVDFSRCVMCFNCSTQCRKGAINFGLKKSDKAKEAEPIKYVADKSRRSFAKELAGMSVAISVGLSKDAKASSTAASKSDNISKYEASNNRKDKRYAAPPGATSIDNFLSKCTGCQICVNACESHLLKPSINEWGLSGIMQPFMDFSAGFCLYECNKCSVACPNGAIKKLTLSEKKLVKIGTAIFNENLCIVKTDHTDCSACGEHCPVQAIEMIPYGKRENSLYIPHVHEDVCVGCGACEHVCPVTPHKALVVQGINKHRNAVVFKESMRVYKPESEKKSDTNSTKKPKATNAFPF